MTRQMSLLVNEQTMALDYFVQSFIDHAIGGILSSLEGVCEIGNVDISIDGDKVTIELNKNSLPINPFVSKIAKSTIVGMVSSLKGVSGQINSLKLSIKR